ncbi:MAG: CPBP family intramembrane metalloprotease [Gemmatimonadota bacterium]|nr:CPBP family intramembrane metalloprotease [Gemmatimonadota bacterium]
MACSIGANWLVVPPLIWLARQQDHVIRVDVYAELVAAMGATAIMLRSIDRRPWSDVGLARSSVRARALLTGWSVGAGANVFTCGVLVLVGLMRFVPSGVGEDGSWVGAALRVSLVLAPAALAEELLCRGYLLTVIRDSVGTRGAVVLTSVLFGALHVSNPGATPVSVVVVIVAGLLLATVRIRFDSIYAAWMTHLAWNWTMAIPFHALVSGIRFEAPGYRGVTLGVAWVSGGDWGPEGGVVAVVGLSLGLGYLYLRRGREES